MIRDNITYGGEGLRLPIFTLKFVPDATAATTEAQWQLKGYKKYFSQYLKNGRDWNLCYRIKFSFKMN